MKRRKHIAHTLTTLNLLGGIMAIFLGIEGYLKIASCLFFVSAIFDSIDVKISRKIGPEGNLERELEILGSLLSFGLVPSIILYQSIIRYDMNLTLLRLLLPSVFLLCVTYRLARHNLLKIKDHYVGIPSSVAGGLLIFSILMFKGSYQIAIVISTFLISALMVANFKFPRLLK